MNANELKSNIISEVDKQFDELKELSLRIHDNPEIAFQEKKAAIWLTDYLQAKGFTTEKGICGLETAFRATYGKDKPIIALLAEYDALPKLGHACGTGPAQIVERPVRHWLSLGIILASVCQDGVVELRLTQRPADTFKHLAIIRRVPRPLARLTPKDG